MRAELKCPVCKKGRFKRQRDLEDHMRAKNDSAHSRELQAQQARY
jgi:hypothetical protein